MGDFKEDSGNKGFVKSRATWFNLAILLLFYPIISLLGISEDPSVLLKSLNREMLMFLLISTIIFQWIIFGFNYMGVYLESTGLRGVGLGKIRGIHFAWAISFLLVSNLLLSGLAWGLAQIGLPMPGELGMLIPDFWEGKIVWVVVSFTAGFCEEIAFRGYLMTRLRLVFGNRSWVIPTIISMFTFGVCHAYQGIPGLIVISAYGLLFSLLYIRTRSLWPCVIAHFFQDFSHLFFPT